MSAAPRPGMLVHQDVRLLRPLCVGGMGSVWAAEHRKLLTEVAVKLIAADLAEDPVARARFEREATKASRVRSPHVVQILDFGVSPHGDPFIVMELLEGEDLRTHLKRVGRLPPSHALSICKQLCHALAKAHAVGIVHRDLKPSNVFLCESPQEALVKLLDFGIAKETQTDSSLSTTGAPGTPFYMSPEQLTGSEPVGHRSDVWALGVLVFEMLTGRRPFEGATTGALALEVHTMPFPSACASVAPLPAAVDPWLSRACARSPSGRFDSVAEAARALELALDLPWPTTLPVSVPSIVTQTDPRPPKSEASRPRRLRHAVAVAVAAGAVAALLVTSALFERSRSSGAPPAAESERAPARALAALAPLPSFSPPLMRIVSPSEAPPPVLAPAALQAAGAPLLAAPARRARPALVSRPAASASAFPPPLVPSAVSADAPNPLALPVERK